MVNGSGTQSGSPGSAQRTTVQNAGFALADKDKFAVKRAKTGTVLERRLAKKTEKT